MCYFKLIDNRLIFSIYIVSYSIKIILVIIIIFSDLGVEYLFCFIFIYDFSIRKNKLLSDLYNINF